MIQDLAPRTQGGCLIEHGGSTTSCGDGVKSGRNIGFDVWGPRQKTCLSKVTARHPELTNFSPMRMSETHASQCKRRFRARHGELHDHDSRSGTTLAETSPGERAPNPRTGKLGRKHLARTRARSLSLTHTPVFFGFANQGINPHIHTHRLQSWERARRCLVASPGEPKMGCKYDHMRRRRMFTSIHANAHDEGTAHGEHLPLGAALPHTGAPHLNVRQNFSPLREGKRTNRPQRKALRLDAESRVGLTPLLPPIH